MALLDSEQDAYDDVTQEQRREAVRRIVELNIEVPPDPATLSRELEAAHEPGGILLTSGTNEAS